MWDPATYVSEGSATWDPDPSRKKFGGTCPTVKYIYPEQADWAYIEVVRGSVFCSSIDV